MSNSASPPLRSGSNAVALLVAAAFFMENLDGTVIATALPQMADSFGTEPEALAVGMTSYLLALAVFVPGSGWVADRYGARRVFPAAILAFTLASVLCGFAGSVTSFVLARILQGAAGALMVPVGRLIVLRGTGPGDLLRAMALLTWPALMAPILGPPVGGFITHAASWRWVFFINLPLGAAALVMALRLVHAGPEGEPRPFDGRGFLLNGAACAFLLYGLEALGRPAGSPAAAGLTLGAGLVLGLVAVRHARRHPHPLVSLEAFRVPAFAATMTGGTVARVAISAMPFLLPLLFQVGLGMNAFASGLLVLWYGLTNLAMKPLTTPILKRFGFRTVLVANTLVIAVSIAGCALIGAGTPALVVAILLMLAGASRSMQLTALNTLAFAELPPGATGPANTLFNMAFQVSVAIGIAVGAIVLRLAQQALPAPPHAGAAAFAATFLVIAGASLLALLDFLRLDPHAGAAVTGRLPAVPSTPGDASA